MRIIVYYNPQQLEAAVSFISKNNDAFLNRDNYIRDSIKEHIKNLASQFPNCNMMGTMGYTLLADLECEGIDSDNNTIHLDILVDPKLGLNNYEYLKEEYIFND